MKLFINADLTSGQWCRSNDRTHGDEQGEFNTLEELAAVLEIHEPSAVEAVIDGAQVGLLGVEMPIKQARQIVKALPFALEEQLASDVSENHLVYLGKQKGLAHAAVIKTQLMEQLLEVAPLKSLTPLPLTLPISEGKWSLLIHNGHATVRTSQYNGFTCNLGQLALYLDHARDNSDEAVSIKIYSVNSESHQLLVAQLETAGYEVVSEEIDTIWRVIEDTRNKHFADLMTGAFKPVIAKENKKPSLLRPVYGLVASIFVLGLFMNIWQGKTQAELASEVKKASVSYYKSLFPGERIRSLNRDFKSKISGASDSGPVNFSGNLGAIGQVLKADADFASIELQGIRFNEKRGGFELDLTASSIAQLERYKSRLGEAGFTVEIRSATNEASKVKGLLKVSRNG